MLATAPELVSVHDVTINIQSALAALDLQAWQALFATMVIHCTVGANFPERILPLHDSKEFKVTRAYAAEAIF
jgi:hypothetical protein